MRAVFDYQRWTRQDRWYLLDDADRPVCNPGNGEVLFFASPEVALDWARGEKKPMKKAQAKFYSVGSKLVLRDPISHAPLARPNGTRLEWRGLRAMQEMAVEAKLLGIDVDLSLVGGRPGMTIADLIPEEEVGDGA